MEAAGYLLFSGISGLGDLGTGGDGVLFGASPAWLWRGLLVLAGYFAYRAVVRASIATLEARVSGTGRERLDGMRRAVRLCYIAGAATYVLIGAFNPYGWTILLMSVLPSSLGGTSGLLWMFHFGGAAGSGPGWYFGRRWPWILAGACATLVYAIVFARTLR